MDDRGREERTVIVDSERAPLIKQAFEEYATGEWSLSDLVHKVDRLARNRDDDSDIMRVLRECGIQLVSASESIDDRSP